MKKEKQEIEEIEIMDGEVVPVSQATPAVHSRFSFLPILNRFREMQIDSFQDVVNAETDLMDAMAEHTSAKQRLLDLPLELEMQTLQRLKRLQDAKRMASCGKAEDKVVELEYKVKIAELEARLKNINKDEADEIFEIRSEMEKDFLRQSIQDEYERKHLRREIKKACQKRITHQEVFEEIYFDYFGSRRPEELNVRETERLRKLKNLFYSFAESL